VICEFCYNLQKTNLSGKMVYLVFFMGLNFVSGLQCTLKPKKTLKS